MSRIRRRLVVVSVQAILCTPTTLLAIHAAGMIALPSLYHEALAGLAIVATFKLGFGCRSHRGSEFTIRVKTCPYCERDLTVGTWKCPRCGELRPTRED